VSTPDNSTTSSWLFPPKTTEVQLDEKWSFVEKKQKNCDPDDEDDWFKGDQWDHVAFDPDSRLVLSVVVGKRITENAVLLLEDVKQRLGGGVPATVTSDEYPAYAEALRSVFGEEVVPPRTGKPGRPAGPRLELPEDLSYATVHKEREKGRVVGVERRDVFGTRESGEPVSTSYLERQNATDRHRAARKGRKTYRFSKDWDVHASVTALTMYSYNFCWAVRTLRERDSQGKWQQRTPAMVAGLADHVWTLEEWLTLPAVQR
jgi:IS1 family transposase